MIRISVILNDYVNEAGLHSVDLLVSQSENGKQVRWKTRTGAYTRKEWFQADAYGNWIKNKRTLLEEENALILNLHTRIQACILKLQAKLEFVSVQDVKSVFSSPTHLSFEEAAHYYCKNSSFTVGTLDAKMSIVRKVLNFYPNLNCIDITPKWLNAYKLQCEKIGNSWNTIHANMRTIKAILNYVQKLELIPATHKPFQNFPLKQAKVHKQKLSLSDIQKLIAVELNPSETKVRDTFMIAFYLGGIRISDLLLLKPTNMKENRLEYTMRKTQTFKSVMIPPQCLQLIEKYRSKESPYLLGYSKTILKTEIEIERYIESKTAYINENLKRIAQKADISVPISTHIARHSFATLAVKNGADVYQVSKALGHSSISVTENYLQSLDVFAQDTTIALVSNLEGLNSTHNNK